MSNAMTFTLPVHCPNWCTLDHASQPAERQQEDAGWHSATAAHSIPLRDGASGGAGTGSVSAVVDGDGTHVWLATDTGDYKLGPDAAEALGRGLLDAAALLRA